MKKVVAETRKICNRVFVLLSGEFHFHISLILVISFGLLLSDTFLQMQCRVYFQTKTKRNNDDGRAFNHEKQFRLIC